jgi:D-alanyl-lipoteichoic acid acyltransferase DltB (MBOAT superfamily)
LRSSSSMKLTPCHPVEWLFALAKLAVGILLLRGVARFVPHDYQMVAGWIGMIGIVMILHFGVFHLLSCGWRTIGVDAQPLMNWPLTSSSISEFWGIRWNTAFRDLTHRFLFRPLTPRIGARGAVLVGFFASGLIHDVVISIPAGGSYGGPTLFFTVQGCAILVSRSTPAKRIGPRKGFAGWLFTMLALLPVFLLFQPVFLREVIMPFMRFIGAIG